MILNERDSRHEQTLHVARQMMTAARTAPKGKGIDILETVTITDEDIISLSNRLKDLSKTAGHDFFLRDAENILKADAIVLIGTHDQVLGLNCGYCGYNSCGEKPASVPCAINTTDVGIAIGSACATAADLRVDSRVMFSAGYAAQSLNWLSDCRNVIAISISVSSKNPFFDRKS